jgi:hypothetical protein
MAVQVLGMAYLELSGFLCLLLKLLLDGILGLSGLCVLGFGGFLSLCRVEAGRPGSEWADSRQTRLLCCPSQRQRCGGGRGGRENGAGGLSLSEDGSLEHYE